MATESLTFVGETATLVGDGYAGFRVGRTYELQVERRDDGTVAHVLDHHEPWRGANRRRPRPSAGPSRCRAWAPNRAARWGKEVIAKI
jgi:hypothetical protein